MHTPAAFDRVISLPENRSALAALHHLARHLQNGASQTASPLYLHGPAGVGKSSLCGALIEEVYGRAPNRSVSLLSGNDFPLPWDQDPLADGAERFREARGSDLLIVEDLQHLPARA